MAENMGYRTEELYLGDCLEVMAGMEPDSVDSIVTDPPYGLAFMGKDWDHGVPGVHFWQEALRVAKPGAHLLAFGGTRTSHRLAVAIEDAGWEIRDTIMWVYGSGFPKSLDVSKAIDKAAGAEREVVGRYQPPNGKTWNLTNDQAKRNQNAYGDDVSRSERMDITAPATYEAQEWDGWGTALKPAWEPIIVARKPLRGTVAANVLAWGTGAINVDGCRVEFDGPIDPTRQRYGQPGCGLPDGIHNHSPIYEGGYRGEYNGAVVPHPDSPRHDARGRWPANLVHDGSDEVVAGFPVTGPGRWGSATITSGDTRNVYGQRDASTGHFPYSKEDGSAARFFYCAKASRADRDEGLEGLPKKMLRWSSGEQSPGTFQSEGTDKYARNYHPTVKPTDLMRWLVRLVTRPGGVVLDPFMGSGSTGKAAALEGFGFVGIEQDGEYLEIARRRIEAVRLPLFGAVHDDV